VSWVLVFINCLFKGYYRGRFARIQKVTVGWCVAIYRCRDIGKAVKTFNRLTEAVSHYIAVSRSVLSEGAS
jgi:hypothetical protein